MDAITTQPGVYSGIMLFYNWFSCKYGNQPLVVKITQSRLHEKPPYSFPAPWICFINIRTALSQAYQDRCLLGLFLGLSTAFTLDYFDHSIKTPEDIDRWCDLPLLGSLPHTET